MSLDQLSVSDSFRPLKKTLEDYDECYQICENCGFDPYKTNKNRCWKCGRRVNRDFSDRALKQKVK